jgi:uncharacterized membrane protein
LTGRSVRAVAPSREDPLVAGLSAAAGGPAGARIKAGRHGWWTAVRVLVVLSMVVLALGVVQKQHCRSDGWTTPDQFYHACYSDLPIVYESSGLAQGVTPYLDAVGGEYLAQPVLTGMAMWGVAKVTPDGPDTGRWYFDLSTLLVAGLLVVLVWLTAAGAGRRRPWDAALLAGCPLLALSGLVSLDLLGVTLAAAGLLLWGRSKPVAAGLLLGLAVTARTYPVLLVLVLGLLALRAGRVREWSTMAVAALATVLAVVTPWAVLNLDGVWSVYRGWVAGAAGYGSLWLVPQTLLADGGPRWTGIGPVTLSSSAVTTLAVLGMGAAIIVGGLLALATPRRPRVAQLAFVMLAIVVITGKAWPVQVSLWLLPLAALARPRWRDHLVWVTGEAMYFFAVWLNIAAETNSDRGLPGSWYAFFISVRVAGLLWLIRCVVADIRRPERDVVRRSSDGPAGWADPDLDDPLGGPLAGADDALVVQVR